MKIKYEFDETLTDDTIVINFHPQNSQIENIKTIIAENNVTPISVYKREQELFLQPNEILFFETDNDIVYAHTINHNYEIKLKLYEIEQLDVLSFIRISKSSIININQIYSIEKTFGAGSLIKFRNTHKEVYVSRLYYKLLKEKLKGRVHYEKK